MWTSSWAGLPLQHTPHISHLLYPLTCQLFRYPWFISPSRSYLNVSPEDQRQGLHSSCLPQLCCFCSLEYPAAAYQSNGSLMGKLFFFSCFFSTSIADGRVTLSVMISSRQLVRNWRWTYKQRERASLWLHRWALQPCITKLIQLSFNGSRPLMFQEISQWVDGSFSQQGE